MKRLQVLVECIDIWLVLCFIIICYVSPSFGQASLQALGSFARLGVMTSTPEANLHVVGTAIVSGSTKTGPLSATGTITGTSTITAGGDITTPTHYLCTGSAPTLGAGCGTGRTVSADSNNCGGLVTTGSGTSDPCTVTFAVAFPNNAHCTVSPNSNVAGIVDSSSKTGFNINPFNSTGYQYFCSGN